MKINLAGDRDRLTLREFSAGDTADGSLVARGSIGLNAAAPSAELTATLQHFHVAARDEAVVTATGDVAVSGTIASPKVTAHLTAEQGDITLPDRLPPSVARLKIVEINGRSAKGPAPAPQKPKRRHFRRRSTLNWRCPAGSSCAGGASTANGVERRQPGPRTEVG